MFVYKFIFTAHFSKVLLGKKSLVTLDILFDARGDKDVENLLLASAALSRQPHCVV